MWIRDPKGPLLTKPGPRGTRTPNHMMWAHSLDEFAWIQRLPGTDVLTVWTRSMLKEFGENYHDINFMDDEVRPRLRKPWPVLRLPSKGNWAKRYPLLSAIDEDSDHEDRIAVRLRRDYDEDGEDGECIAPVSFSPDILRVADPSRLVDNDPDNPILTSLGNPYLKVWIPEIREYFRVKREADPSLTEPVVVLDHTEDDSVVRLVDECGIMEALIQKHIEGEDGYGRIVLAPPPVDLRPKTEKKSDTPDTENTSITVDELAQDAASGTAAEPSGSSNLKDEAAEKASEKKGKSAKKNRRKKQSGENDNATGSNEKEDIGKKSAEKIKSTSNTDAHSSSATDGPKVGTRSPFFVGDLPKLEQFIPEDFFPDILLVHDPSGITDGASKEDKSKKVEESSSKKPMKYKRIFPKLARDEKPEKPKKQSGSGEESSKERGSSSSNKDDKGGKTPEEPRVAHLHLDPSNRLGSGNHSLVYRAPLTLPKPLSGRSRTGQVTVAAKTSKPPLGDRRLFQNEAEIYNMFPKHLMQEYCGYNLVTPMKYPVPVGAVVPKFYGYYIPVDDKGNSLDLLHMRKNVRDYHEADWPSPILLLEECGEPINASKLTMDQKYVRLLSSESDLHV